MRRDASHGARLRMTGLAWRSRKPAKQKSPPSPKTAGLFERNNLLTSSVDDEGAGLVEVKRVV